MKLFGKRILWIVPCFLAAICFFALTSFSPSPAPALESARTGFTGSEPVDKIIDEQLETYKHLDMEAIKSERFIGAPDAPVTMIEFSSLSCGHCAHFHKDVLPQLKKDYVDTGKLKIIFREFPLNAPALKASVLARCVDPIRYYGLTDMLFKNQEKWLSSKDLNKTLFQFGRLAGLSEERFNACMNNNEIEDFLLLGYQNATTEWKVESTPTFIIDDGAHTISGSRDYEFFKNLIEGRLQGK